MTKREIAPLIAYLKTGLHTLSRRWASSGDGTGQHIPTQPLRAYRARSGGGVFDGCFYADTLVPDIYNGSFEATSSTAGSCLSETRSRACDHGRGHQAISAWGRRFRRASITPIIWRGTLASLDLLSGDELAGMWSRRRPISRRALRS